MVVSTLSHCAFLRALAYDMRWPVRCRRWKPIVRRRRLWCAVRSSAKCFWPRVQVTQARVSVTSALNMRTCRVNGASSYSSRWNRLYHAHASRIRRFTSGIMSALASTRPPLYRNCIVCIYLWPAASTTSGEVRIVYKTTHYLPATKGLVSLSTWFLAYINYGGT